MANKRGNMEAEEVVSNVTEMSESSFFFFLPPGILKTDQMSCVIYNQKGKEFSGGTISVGGRKSDLKAPSLLKDFWSWATGDYQDVFAASESSLSIQINGEEPAEVNLDKLTFVCQVDERLDKEQLPEMFLFKFKAGYFARIDDYKDGVISIEKVNVLHYQKRIAYEAACKHNIDVNKRFEELCEDGFNELYNRYAEFDETRRAERLRLYHENLKKSAALPVSNMIDLQEDVQPESPPHSQPPQTAEPFSLDQKYDEFKDVSAYPQRDEDKSPTAAEVQQFLKELNPLFPLLEDQGLFCGIREDDNDLNSQRMFCFNLCHFLVLFGVFTGVTYDYRLSISEGVWKIEERVSGNEIKRDLMTKSNVLDNPYREAIILCLRKLAEDLRLPKTETIIATIAALQNYYLTLS